MRSLRALVPDEATRWWIVRPRTIFDHPRLGAALSRSYDDAGERALLDRAARVGYDVRTVERALVAQTRAGELAVGLGSFDAARIVALLWERLLPPRRRGDGARGVTRVEGVLGRAPVAVAVDAACGAAAWAEGDTRLVDRVIVARASSLDDPDAVLVAHAELGDARERELLGALSARASSVDATASLVDAGLALDLTLHGAFTPADLPGLRARVAVVARSELLRAIGADAWAREGAVRTAAGDASLSLRVTIPWAALDALADVLRGRITQNTAQNAQGF